MERVDNVRRFFEACQQLTNKPPENVRPRRHEPIPHEEFSPADPDHAGEVELNRGGWRRRRLLFRRGERTNRLLSLSTNCGTLGSPVRVRCGCSMSWRLRRGELREG